MKQNNQWKTPLHQPASSLRLRLQRMVKTLKVLVCGIVHNPNELIRSMLNMLLARKDKPSNSYSVSGIRTYAPNGWPALSNVRSTKRRGSPSHSCL